MHSRTFGILIPVVLVVAVIFAAGRLGRRPTAAFLTWGEPGRREPSTFDKPRCVAIAPDGTVYVLDLTGRIQHFTGEGKYLGQLQMPDVSVGRPQGIAADAEGRIWVADTHYNQIVRFDTAGKIDLVFGTTAASPEEAAPGELYWPCAIVVSPKGFVYTAEYGGHDRIQKWSLDGHPLDCWGRFGERNGEFMRPAGLALDTDGNMYVADAANHRVQVFTPEGKFVRAWKGEPSALLDYPYDISIDARDRLFVVEYGGHRIQCFDTDGRMLGRWGKLAPDGKDGFANPWGLAATPSGVVYVTDTYNYRVVRAPIALP